MSAATKVLISTVVLDLDAYARFKYSIDFMLQPTNRALTDVNLWNEGTYLNAAPNRGSRTAGLLNYRREAQDIVFMGVNCTLNQGHVCLAELVGSS